MVVICSCKVLRLQMQLSSEDVPVAFLSWASFALCLYMCGTADFLLVLLVDVYLSWVNSIHSHENP